MDAPLLMIPGPTPVSVEVLAALAEPVRSHTGPENAATVRRIQDGIRTLCGARSARVYVFSGSGTLAMEAAVINHVSPGERVVVVSHGYFGDRFVDVARAYDVRTDVVSAPWGDAVTPDQLRAAVREGAPPAAVCLTHVDTSSGVLADVARLTEAARAEAPDATVIVDGVCATGGIAEAMDAWDVDVMLTGAQKALGIPPGLAILATSRRADERRERGAAPRAYYADLRRWDPVMDDPQRYFSTHAVSLLRALEVSLDAIFAEGLDARFARHRRMAAMLRDGMAELGFASLTNADRQAPTLSVLRLPPHADDAATRAGMAARGVIVAACLGPWAGQGIRIGHMGKVSASDITRTLDAAAAALKG